MFQEELRDHTGLVDPTGQCIPNIHLSYIKHLAIALPSWATFNPSVDPPCICSGSAWPPFLSHPLFLVQRP